MFEKLRNPTRTRSGVKKFFYGLLFAAIILMFVFMTGTGSSIGGAAGGIAAVVNDKVITYSEYARAYSNQEQRVRSQSKGLPDALRKQYMKGMGQRVLEQLIQYELATQLAVKSGIYVSSNELREEISSMPTFQENGKFQASRYQQLLQANKINTATFEEDIRGNLAFDRFRNIFSNSVKATSEDIELENFAKSQKINIDYIEISQDLLKRNIVIPDSEMNQFVKNETEKVKTYYNDNKSTYTLKNKTKASHILIKTKSQSDEDFKLALDTITKIKSEITDDNFADIAKKYSDDTGSKVKGGSLGEFDDNVSFVPPFKKAALSLPVGKLSEPIKTRFGYHIIKVTGKTPGRTKTMEEVQNEIAKKFLTDKKVEDDMAGLTSEKGVNMAAIDKIKDKYNVKWQSTGLFSLDQKNIPKLGDRDKIWQTISNLKNNEDSKLIETDGKYFVVKLKTMKYEPIKTGSFEDQIAQLSRARSGDAVQSWVDSQSKSARIKRNLKVLNN